MRSLATRAILAGTTALLTLGVVASMWAGCATSSDGDMADTGTPPFDGSNSDTRFQVVDVRDETATAVNLCGEEQLCDPDVPAICTPLMSDAAADTTPVDAEDAVGDGSTSGTSSACRVVKRDNRTIASCAPAGKTLESQFCKSDDDCAPGLACTGDPEGGRCFRFCCKAWTMPQLAPDAGGGTHYCTPQPLAARPTEKVPVWVKLDNCTLLDDMLQCIAGHTCTVVTNDGRTSCVQAGTGRDYASCATEPCDRGYVCLGTTDRRCRKLCKESEGSTACPAGGYCQRVPTIPDGFGICAGGDAGTMK
jgi:hypothetical protein